MSFTKYKNTFRGVNNIILATSQEETIHGQFGMAVINIMKQEYPEWFDEDLYKRIEKACLKAYAAEIKILDWIFEEGELSFLPRATVENFIKDRYNQSMRAVGFDTPLFEVDAGMLEDVLWFNEELYTTGHMDFFGGRPVAYAKGQQAITEDDLFDD